jgi:hypothetical protein
MPLPDPDGTVDAFPAIYRDNSMHHPCWPPQWRASTLRRLGLSTVRIGIDISEEGVRAAAGSRRAPEKIGEGRS